MNLIKQIWFLIVCFFYSLLGKGKLTHYLLNKKIKNEKKLQKAMKEYDKNSCLIKKVGSLEYNDDTMFKVKNDWRERFYEISKGELQ